MTTIRLNATMERAPASVARWRVTKCRKFQSLDGGGFDATVTLDGAVVGSFANEGTGGGTWFRYNTREAREAMEELSREWATVNPELATIPTIPVGDDGSAGEPERRASEEHICDSLVENFELAKKLNGMVKRGSTPVLTRAQAAAADDGGEWHVEFGIREYGTVKSPMTDALRAWAVEKDVLVWTGDGWTEGAAL